MLVKYLRRIFGSIRFFMLLLSFVVGIIVVAVDLLMGKRGSAQLYGYLTSLSGLAAVFVWKDTERPSGYTPAGYKHSDEGVEGPP